MATSSTFANLEKVGQKLRYGLSAAPSAARPQAPAPVRYRDPNAGPDWAAMKGYNPNKENYPAASPTPPATDQNANQEQPKTPTSTPTPSPNTDMGDITPPKSFDEFTADQNKNVTPVDEAAIRENARQQMQARIDATNALFDTMVKSEETRGVDRLGQTRAINARSGILGQDFGNRNMDETTRVNAEAVAAINAERNNKIAQIMGDIDKSAEEKIKAKKEEALGRAEAYTKYLESSQTKVRDAISKLGQNGMTINRLKTEAPDKLKKLLDSSGLDEFQLGVMLNEADKEAKKYTYKVENGLLYGYRTNQQTGEAEVITKPIPGLENGNYKVQVTPDGTALVIPEHIDSTKPLDEQIKIYGKEGQFAKTPAPKAINNEKTAIDHMIALFSGTKTLSDGSVVPVMGQDGFVSPEDYTSARNNWIDKGFNPTTFDTKFKGFRNPNNPWYPVTKRSKSSENSGFNAGFGK